MTPQRFQKLQSVINHRQSNLAVVLENVYNPNNVSAVMRTCDAVGVQDIYVINEKTPPVKSWGRRSNAGTAGWVDVFQYDDAESLIKEIRSKYQFVYASNLKPGSVPVFELDLTTSIALVFGNEQYGISEKLSSAADINFIIPQVGMNPSLNISVACAVTLYESFRQRTLAGAFDRANPDAEQVNNLSRRWGVSD